MAGGYERAISSIVVGEQTITRYRLPNTYDVSYPRQWATPCRDRLHDEHRIRRRINSGSGGSSKEHARVNTSAVTPLTPCSPRVLGS